MVPCQAANYASQFQVVLDDPEMKALLAACPQALRVLAPLCRMLGIETAATRARAEERARTGAEAAMARETVKRVRKPRPKVDWGRIPLPRGVMAWARREGFGKVPRG